MDDLWITDRLPTEADGDEDGDVRMKLRPYDDSPYFVHWSYVGAGAPWQRDDFWEPPAKPEPAETSDLWITDRLPTGADGDDDGDVVVRQRRSVGLLQRTLHWSYVGAGIPWHHTFLHPSSEAPGAYIYTKEVKELLGLVDEKIARLKDWAQKLSR